MHTQNKLAIAIFCYACSFYTSVVPRTQDNIYILRKHKLFCANGFLLIKNSYAINGLPTHQDNTALSGSNWNTLWGSARDRVGAFYYPLPCSFQGFTNAILEENKKRLEAKPQQFY